MLSAWNVMWTAILRTASCAYACAKCILNLAGNQSGERLLINIQSQREVSQDTPLHTQSIEFDAVHGMVWLEYLHLRQTGTPEIFATC
jgi:hypothetical protein